MKNTNTPTTPAQGQNVRANCPNCYSKLRYYDGALGYEALKCTRCDYELDLHAEANAKATAERLAADKIAHQPSQGFGSASTPGPWHLGPIHKDGTFAIHSAHGSIVHCTPFGSTLKSAEANARLIAAAPELLTVLKHVVSIYGHLFTINTLDHCRAAIAKAEGK